MLTRLVSLQQRPHASERFDIKYLLWRFRGKDRVWLPRRGLLLPRFNPLINNITHVTRYPAREIEHAFFLHPLPSFSHIVFPPHLFRRLGNYSSIAYVSAPTFDEMDSSLRFPTQNGRWHKRSRVGRPSHISDFYLGSIIHTQSCGAIFLYFLRR